MTKLLVVDKILMLLPATILFSFFCVGLGSRFFCAINLKKHLTYCTMCSTLSVVQR
nr:MAG TPA: hypothetical protein [Caudoviricetes sp.]